MKIADISKYQGNIDWEQASKELSFCILRASCGTAEDAKYAQNAEACERCGVPYHAYHYLKATDFDGAEGYRACGVHKSWFVCLGTTHFGFQFFAGGFYFFQSAQ